MRNPDEFTLTFKSLLGGIGGFVDLLANMFEQGKEECTGEAEAGDKKGLHGYYNMSVKLGNLRKDEERFNRPFGRNPEGRSRPPEQLCDIFDEGDHFLIIAELEDVLPENLALKVDQRGIELGIAVKGETAKTITLPVIVDPGSIQWNYSNNILEVRVWKDEKAG